MRDSGFYWQLIAMFLIPVISVMAAIRFGQWYGRYRGRKAAAADMGSVGAAVGAIFGLLAFMLAFTFQIASQRFDTRRSLLLQ